MSEPTTGATDLTAVDRLERLIRIRGAVEMAVGARKGGRLLEDIQFLLDMIPGESQVVVDRTDLDYALDLIHVGHWRLDRLRRALTEAESA